MNHDPFAACEERAVIRVHLANGTTLTGSYTTRAQLHFVHRTGPDLRAIGEVSGPFSHADVLEVEIIKTRTQVLHEHYARLHGERVPGKEPVTREDHRHRLETIARAVVDAGDDWRREMQLRRQFDEAADHIGLAAGKRRWILNEARWLRRANAPPTMADLWVEDVASPSWLARPRPHDFDPDIRVRRRRTPLPPHVEADPCSIPNILRALRHARLKARITRLGDPPWDTGHIQIDLPFKGRSRFVAIAQRTDEGNVMHWRLVWDGNESKAGLKRYARATRSDEYARIRRVLYNGHYGVQGDLFVNLPY
jgi:hypothetical protein